MTMEGKLHQEGKETEVNEEITVVDLEVELIMTLDEFEHLKDVNKKQTKEYMTTRNKLVRDEGRHV